MAALADHVNPMSDSNTIVLPALTAASGDQQFMQWFVWLEDPPPRPRVSHLSSTPAVLVPLPGCLPDRAYPSQG